MASPVEQLEERIRGGDPSALAELITQRRPQLLAFIERNLGPALRTKVEPEDLLQEVSIACLRSLAEVDLSARDPFSWLCQVAERRIIDAHRRFFGAQKRSAGREVPLSGPVDSSRAVIDLLVASMTSPSQAFSRDVRELALVQALATLPEDSQAVLRLRYVEGLATKDIARQVGKTDGAVRVLLTRSVKRLEQLLGPQEGDSRKPR